MDTEVFNRYEYKYLVDVDKFNNLSKLISENMLLDDHNVNNKLYTISNIYYDTNDDYLIRRSLSRPLYKEKLRLRTYDVPDMQDKAFVEIKKKFNGIVNKRRTLMNVSDAYDLLNSLEFSPTEDYLNNQLYEIKYFLKNYSPVPKVFIAYDRLAYVSNDNSDLRVSFDFNIRSRRDNLKLQNPFEAEPLLSKNIAVMEIKTAYSMPLWLTCALTGASIKRIRFSKYGKEYQKYLVSKNVI